MDNDLISRAAVLDIIDREIKEDVMQEAYYELRECRELVRKLPASEANDAISKIDRLEGQLDEKNVVILTRTSAETEPMQLADAITDYCQSQGYLARDFEVLITVLRWEARRQSKSYT